MASADSTTVVVDRALFEILIRRMAEILTTLPLAHGYLRQK